MPTVKTFVVNHISNVAICNICKPTDELKRAYTSQLAARLNLKMSKKAIEYIAQSFDRVVPIKSFMQTIKLLNNNESKVYLKQIRKLVERM